jgi:DNA recombination protein RmuC
LKNQLENLQKLNQQMSEEALNLTNALKGQVKTQGTWGEMILEKVLEKSGLVNGREYELQVYEKKSNGQKGRPDAIVHLPENRDIIIDAKVSLKAYEQISVAHDEKTQLTLVKEHVKSIRTHINNLSSKNYQKLNNIKSMDFVLLFIPIEGAIAVAIHHDPNLFGEAFDKNIILVSPSTLLATLRTADNIWKYEKQNQNARKIAKKAGALYDKFVAFVKDLENLGVKLSQCQKSYDSAHKKLSSGRGNLISTSESFKELGISVSKSLPQQLLEESDGE